MHPRLNIGTSSFSDESWVGPFYPAGTKPADMLPYYATKYSTVEVDSTYYRAPSLSMCQRWHGVTPSSFRFSLKVPSEITHMKALVGAEADWACCPDCGSQRIIPEVWVVDQSPQTSEGMVHVNSLRVRIDGKPEAWIFKESLYSRLVARICGECGRTDLRVKDPRQLYEKYVAAAGA